MTSTDFVLRKKLTDSSLFHLFYPGVEDGRASAHRRALDGRGHLGKGQHAPEGRPQTPGQPRREGRPQTRQPQALLLSRRRDQTAQRKKYHFQWQTGKLDTLPFCPQGYSLYEHRHSNRLIEEFMLLANMSVAEKIFEAFPKLAVLRCHPPPKGRMLDDLCKQLANMGKS